MALLVAALFATLFQGFLVQAHAHMHRDVASIVHMVEAQAVAAATRNGSTQQDETDCPLCWEIAHAGAFVLPEGTVLRTPEPSIVWLVGLLQSVSARNGRSHTWRSRAPPLPSKPDDFIRGSRRR
ncbi:DUF2946 family protein [Sphingomonas sp. PB2P12]|uniref:DUF2946 family protein n=1 Tax=Sphingomonas sandaracina TaxID=3096157 RepID=UPI002FCBF867